MAQGGRNEISAEAANKIYGELEKGIKESPIDVNIGKATDVSVPPLVWHHYELAPKKMKLTNTGHTIILSAKWHQERPFISGGPLYGAYVFSQLHFHWGATDMEGSEHAADGTRHPLEMHVVMFKSCYLTQESALKERDGIVTLVYFYKLQNASDAAIQRLTDNIKDIIYPFTSIKVDPIPLSTLLKKFEEDYLGYWGAVSSAECGHYILWLICREPSGIASEQVDMFRMLLDQTECRLRRNYRDLVPLNGRTLFLFNGSNQKYSTLLALPDE